MKPLARKRLLTTLALASVAELLSETLQRSVVEPRLASQTSLLFDLSPLYPIIVVALLAGFYSDSLLDGLAHAAVLTAGVVVVGVLVSWMLGLEYTHDIWVGDPGFLEFVSIQLLVLMCLVAFVVEGTLLARRIVRKLQGRRLTVP